MRESLLEQADLIPPCYCRLCGRVGRGRAKTYKELSELSGLHIKRVKWLSRQPTWSKVTIAEAEAFSQACDVDLLRPRKKLFYLKRAFAMGGPKALSGGLGVEYVKKQLRIRMNYEKQTGST